MSTTGIGRRLKSVRTPRAALTPMPIGTRYIVSRRWFFPVAPDALAGTSAGGGTTTGALTVAVAVPANPQRAGMARVTGGWTGSITITSGAISVVMSPPARTSAVEVMDLAVRAAQRAIGGVWRWWPSNDGEIVITASAAFDLVATGTVETRLGFTGTYSGSPGYVADAAHADGIYPTLGLLLDGADGVARQGVTLGTGLYVAASQRGGQSGEVTCYGTFQEIVELVDTFIVAASWDVVLGGIWGSRVRVEEVRRAPWGVSPDRTTLALAVSEVTL